jgi:hypothetical protein
MVDDGRVDLLAVHGHAAVERRRKFEHPLAVDDEPEHVLVSAAPSHRLAEGLARLVVLADAVADSDRH